MDVGAGQRPRWNDSAVPPWTLPVPNSVLRTGRRRSKCSESRWHAVCSARRMYYDFVAHCRWPLAPLCERETALWLWSGLRRMFPSALAAALMPNHLHVVAPAVDGRAERERLRRLLAAFAREFELGPVWSPVPEPKPLLSKDKVARQVRYVSLNPCRPFHLGTDDLVLADDPLAWEWSTHRDAVGAIVDPWVTAQAIAEATGIRTTDPVQWLHRYVSSDPHVAVAGTATPVPAAKGSIDELIVAVCASHRAEPADLRRRSPVRTTFLCAAARLGLPAALVAQTAVHASRGRGPPHARRPIARRSGAPLSQRRPPTSSHRLRAVAIVACGRARWHSAPTLEAGRPSRFGLKVACARRSACDDLP